MDADDIDEVVDLDDEQGQHPEDDLDGEMAAEDVREEDATDELDVAADATVTDVDNSVITSREHTGPVYCVSMKSAGDKLMALTGSGDDSGLLWKVEEAALVPAARLSGHSDSVVACGISATNKHYGATGSYDGTVRIHSHDGTLLHVLEGPAADIEWLCWHDKGDVILAGSADNTTWMWSVTDTQAACMQVFAGHEEAVTCGLFAMQGKLAVTGSADQSVKVWDPKSGKVNMTFSGSGWSEGPITSLAASLTSPVILASSQDGTARLANISSKRILGSLAHDPTGEQAETSASVESVMFDQIHNWAYTTGTDGQMLVWDLNTLSRRSAFTCAGGGIKLHQFANTGLIGVTLNVGCVDAFDPRAEGLRMRLSGHKGMVLDIGSVDHTVMTAGDDGSVKLFDLRKV